MASSASLYYTPSGRFSLSSLITILPLAIALQILLAIVYAYGDLYIPFVKLRFLLTAGFGLIAGGVTLWTLRLAKVRNNQVAVLWSITFALLGWYVSWVAWSFAFLHRAADEPISINVAALSQPTTMWHLVSVMNQEGVWAMSHSDPMKGAMLWLVWGLEALIILGIAVAIPLASFGKRPYCETCDKWCNETKSIATLKMADSPELIRQVESKNFRHFDTLGPAEPEALNFLRLDIHNCPLCANTNTLSIKAVTVNVDKKGTRSESAKDVVEMLLVSSEELADIRETPARLIAAASAPPPTNA